MCYFITHNREKAHKTIYSIEILGIFVIVDIIINIEVNVITKITAIK